MKKIHQVFTFLISCILILSCSKIIKDDLDKELVLHNKVIKIKNGILQFNSSKDLYFFSNPTNDIYYDQILKFYSGFNASKDTLNYVFQKLLNTENLIYIGENLYKFDSKYIYSIIGGDYNKVSMLSNLINTDRINNIFVSPGNISLGNDLDLSIRTDITNTAMGNCESYVNDLENGKTYPNDCGINSVYTYSAWRSKYYYFITGTNGSLENREYHFDIFGSAINYKNIGGTISAVALYNNAYATICFTSQYFGNTSFSWFSGGSNEYGCSTDGGTGNSRSYTIYEVQKTEWFNSTDPHPTHPGVAGTFHSLTKRPSNLFSDCPYDDNSPCTECCIEYHINHIDNSCSLPGCN